MWNFNFHQSGGKMNFLKSGKISKVEKRFPQKIWLIKQAWKLKFEFQLPNKIRVYQTDPQ